MPENTTMSKWNDETVATLESLAGEGQVSQDTLQSIADEMEITKRSVGSKLRKMGYDVQLASEKASSFSSEDEDAIRAFLSLNHATHTYTQIAEQTCNAKFGAKQIQGKILSMELTACVAPTPAKETVKKYSDAEEAQIVKMCEDGAFLEAIAAKVGRQLASVRGKALSLFKTGAISAVPKQEHVKGTESTNPFADIKTVDKTVEELAELIGKSVRGVKVMLTNRELSASDYAFKAKAA